MQLNDNLFILDYNTLITFSRAIYYFIKPIGSLKNFFDQYQRVVNFIVNMNSLLSRLKLLEKSPEHTWVVE